MKKKLSHYILYFPNSFKHRLVLEDGTFKNIYYDLYDNIFLLYRSRNSCAHKDS